MKSIFCRLFKNKLRGKISQKGISGNIKSVCNMKENIFVDTGFSRFVSHFSLERTGAMHVALCDSVGSYFRHWCRAFTLAEVLVTLGIIGVVAAITMPTLIDNHQKKVAATRLEKFYSMMSQAVYQWVGDTGFIPGTTYNFPENTKYNGKGLEQWYNANLGKYIKSTSQVSTDSGMFVAFADGSGFNAYQTGGNMYFFFCIEAKYCNTQASSAEGYFDGKRTFLFDFANGDFYASLPGQQNMSREELLRACKYGNSDNSEVSSKGRRHTCTRLIQIDGWQIKDDYPWSQIMLEKK